MSDHPKDRTAFIPAWLDDAGLRPHPFRAYARISRRGQCTESLARMAKACRMKRLTLQGAIAELLKLNLISKEDRFGRTSVYRVQPSPKGDLGDKPTQIPKGTTTLPQRGSTHLVPKGIYKGPPSEGSPSKGGGKPAPLGIEKALAGGRKGKLPEMWKLLKDKKELSALIKSEKEKLGPDRELLSGYRSEASRIDDQIKQHGRNSAPVDPEKVDPPVTGRNAGTYNANSVTGSYAKLVEKMNRGSIETKEERDARLLRDAM